MDNNLLYKNANSGYIGAQGGDVINNVVMDDVPVVLSAINYQGGLSIDGISNTSPNNVTRVEANLFARGHGAAFNIAGGMGASLDFRSNVLSGWEKGITNSDALGFTISVSNNQFQGGVGFSKFFGFNVDTSARQYFANNTYFAPAGPLVNLFCPYISGIQSCNNYAFFLNWSDELGSSFKQISYADPKRSPVTYFSTLAEGQAQTPSFDKLLEQMRMQSRFYWRQSYRVPVINNYLRAGYNMKAVKVSYALSQ